MSPLGWGSEGGCCLPSVNSDPLAPRLPTVVCHRGAAGGAAPGPHPLLLSLILVLPRGRSLQLWGAGRALPQRRLGGHAGRAVPRLSSREDPQGPGVGAPTTSLVLSVLRGWWRRGTSDTPLSISTPQSHCFAPVPSTCANLEIKSQPSLYMFVSYNMVI